MSFKKYITAAKISWENGFIYRLNFIMWRVRSVIQIITIYFLWLAITTKNPNSFGYDQVTLLTYVLGTSLMRAVVFSSRSIDAQREISSGDLNNYLIKPLNYFKYWLFRDFADKALNIVFSLIEIIILFFIFRPSLFFQTNILTLVQFLLLSGLAMIMYFYFSFIISMTTFWYPESNGWPQRFLIFTVLEFLSGGLFPLDILPKPIFNIVNLLPSAHFLFTPLQVYLGRISGSQIFFSAGNMLLWTVLLWALAKFMWHKGLKIYGAYGR